MSLLNLLTIGVLSGVPNKFPDGIDTKMDKGKEMIELLAKNKELSEGVNASIALINELTAEKENAALAVEHLTAENERLNSLVEGGDTPDPEKVASATIAFGEFLGKSKKELTAIATEAGWEVTKKHTESDILKMLYEDLMKPEETE